MKNPWLSIIIPTFNGEQYLPFALNSIVAQNQHNIECIVVDDGSTDSTLTIVNSYSTKLNLKIINQNHRGNWVSNTNIGICAANGEYICFLHQDDFWLTNRLSTIKSLVEQYPDIGFFVHSSVFVDSNGKHLGFWRCPLPHFPLLTQPSIFLERLLIQNFISIPAPIFKKALADNSNAMDSNLWYTADWDFWLKIGALGQSIYYPQPLSAFRIHSGSQTIRRSLAIDDFKEQMSKVLIKHLKKLAISEHQKLKIMNIANFSIQLNYSLASKIHGNNIQYFVLLKSFLALGPIGGGKYLLYSRIWERIFARVKALI